jgi:hypothetical protein
MDWLTEWMVKSSNRSWWQARYSSGKVVSEWSTLTSSNLGQTHWELIPKKGMVGLRLLCPNGMAGELAAPEGYRFFQLKAGGTDVGPGGGHYIDAHIIGVVEDHDGRCLCRAWDYHLNQLIQFNDNIFAMKFCQIGKLALEPQGLKV